MGFGSIFWGFIFFFDFNIGNFDILPDIIGYILIFSGLGRLQNLSGRFVTARKVALPLLLLSVFDIYKVNIPLNNLSMNPTTLFFLLVGATTTILNILLVYNICMGIEEKANELSLWELAGKARSRWQLYLAFQLVFLLSLVFVILIPLLFIPLFIFSIVTYVLILGLMKNAERELTIE
jgi:hypothetical protein